jgi:DNA polymerase-1
VLARFKDAGMYGTDTETTGLRPYQGDRLFSVILADATESFYLNFNPKEYVAGQWYDLPEEWWLPREWLARLQEIFSNPDSYWFLANAKFDLAMLAREGLSIAGTVHDTETQGRIVRNDMFQYGLDALSKQIGREKSTAVEDFIAEHGLFTPKLFPGKKKKEKVPHYDRVPLDVIAPYGCTDGEITRLVGISQLEELKKLDAMVPVNVPRPSGLAANERKLIKTCFAMEQVGLQLDLEYCRRAKAYEESREANAMHEFKAVTGLEFVDGPKVLKEAFTKMGEKYPLTEKGNPSFTDEVLEGFSTPVAKLVQQIRAAHKKAFTYYANFLEYADENGVLHANIRQGGTETGRMSMSEPNMQNVPKEESADEVFPVKRAVIARPGFQLAELDYSQAEYRLMLDYAGEMSVINQILEGLDVHTATGKTMGVERQEAKTINFMLLYGGGPGKLATALKISLGKARALRDQYFERLPQVSKFIRAVTSVAENRGYIVNWAGRVNYFNNPEFCYKAPNTLIQGGVADIAKFAMNNVHDFLVSTRKKSRLLLQVHDSLLLEIHESETDILPELKRIMCAAYPHKFLPMDVDAAMSTTSWADKKKVSL